MFTVVIPVYNEEKTIVNLLHSILNFPGLDRLIVVDDASTDKTYELIKNLPITIIRHNKNLGKDQAVLSGVKAAATDCIILVDGDLVGLNADHIKLLTDYSDNYRMVLGILRSNRWWWWFFFLNRYFFTYTGLRLVRREDILAIPIGSLSKFRLESILSYIARQSNWKVKRVVLTGIKHVIKEKKFGWRVGIIRRCQMIYDIVSFYGKKYFRI